VEAPLSILASNPVETAAVSDIAQPCAVLHAVRFATQVTVSPSRKYYSTMLDILSIVLYSLGILLFVVSMARSYHGMSHKHTSFLPRFIMQISLTVDKTLIPDERISCTRYTHYTLGIVMHVFGMTVYVYIHNAASAPTYRLCSYPELRRGHSICMFV
jgi:hypothetical protein